MVIAGLHRCSFVDYPRRLAAVLFTGGCNWNCYYCHNRAIAARNHQGPRLDPESVLDWLQDRANTLDGVVISGGEPTLHADLPELVRRIKAMGYMLKLDTNGSRPAMLRELLGTGLLDYVAMDIKAPLSKYERFCGVPVDQRALNESIDLLLRGDIDYEFRTTVVPQLTPDDILDMARRIRGADRYVLQQYRPVPAMDESPQAEARPHPEQLLASLAERLRREVRHIQLRGFNHTPHQAQIA